MAALTQMLDADIADGEGRIGVGAARNGAPIKLFFPISIVAGARRGEARDGFTGICSPPTAPSRPAASPLNRDAIAVERLDQ